MNSISNRLPGTCDPTKGAGRRALVFRIGALGDVLLTRRLTYSLSLAGLRSTLFGPARHASLLLADPWIEGVLDSESPDFAGAFTGEWSGGPAGFEVALVISQSVALARAAKFAARSLIQVSPAPSRDDTSIAQQWAEAADNVGEAFAGRLPLLPVDRRRSLVSGATFIHPGSGSAQKNWPAERFVELSLALESAGHHVVWIRGPAEPDSTREAPGFEVIDRPPLEVLGATLAEARLYIGNDSGVSHLAAAVGAPTVAIFGPTSAVVWRPDGPRVQAVGSATGRLEDIGAESVLAVIDELTRLEPGGA